MHARHRASNPSLLSPPSRIPRRLAIIVLLLASCQSGGSSTGDAAVDEASPADASVSNSPDAEVTPVSTCAEEFLGTGDGCDCGCGVVDPDCPSPTSVADCQYFNCAAEYEVNPGTPSLCQPIAVPAGWTCSASLYGGDGLCTCGCGVLDDKDCQAPLAVAACAASQNGCPSGSSPDPMDPTSCVPSPAGWTCNWKGYYDDDCDCGCGIPDPGCPVNTHVSQCDSDECASGFSPNPMDLTECIDDAPQDGWDCDLSMLLDGNCDCGCGTQDPDCGASTSSASCDTFNCPAGDELQPNSLSECWEICTPIAEPVGNATCTNGGFISIFNSCNTHLSACSDGNSYEVECVGGDCVCRVNGACVAHATGSCSLNFTCNWSLVDNT